MPTIPSSDSDLDDDVLGITPRTPPESPFYRGHRQKPKGNNTKTTTKPSTSKQTPEHQSTSKEQPAKNTNGENMVNPPRKKKKNSLQQLANEEDKLYKDLNKLAKKSK